MNGKFTVCVRLPLVPVITTVYEPAATVLGIAIVSVLVAGDVIEVGANVAVAPDGTPLALNATLLLKPYRSFTDTVAVPLEVCAIVKLVGDTDNEKFGGSGVVNASLDIGPSPTEFTADTL